MGVSIARWGTGGVLVRRWIPTPLEAAMAVCEGVQSDWMLGQDEEQSR